MALTRINQFQAADGKGDELFAFLKSLEAHITGSKGNNGYEVLQSQADPHILMVIERWDSEADHIASVNAFPQEEMKAAMPLLGAPPTGSYFAG